MDTGPRAPARHGRTPRHELFGPWDQGAGVRAAILESGREFGLLQVGAKAYSTANLESGWIPPTLPAIFTGAKMRGFREWLTTENLGALGGSLNHGAVEDYYLTPYDLGFDRHVAFDHDFIGRDALEKVAANPPRTKVSLAWNSADLTEKVFGSIFQPGTPAK